MPPARGSPEAKPEAKGLQLRQKLFPARKRSYQPCQKDNNILVRLKTIQAAIMAGLPGGLWAHILSAKKLLVTQPKNHTIFARSPQLQVSLQDGPSANLPPVRLFFKLSGVRSRIQRGSPPEAQPALLPASIPRAAPQPRQRPFRACQPASALTPLSCPALP
jgi:hypothetical protein